MNRVNILEIKIKENETYIKENFKYRNINRCMFLNIKDSINVLKSYKAELEYYMERLGGLKRYMF